MNDGSDRAGLLTFGETMGLISTQRIGTLDIARDAAISIGGAESNVAIGVARLGGAVTWVGRVGPDAIGDLIERRLAAESITTHALRDSAFTGLMVRHTRAGTAVHVDYHRAGSAGSRIAPDDLPAELIGRASVLHITGITPGLSGSAAAAVSAAVAVARDAGATVSIDINYRRKLWSPEAAHPVLAELVAAADLVFAGVEEAQLVLGVTETDPTALATALHQRGPAQAVIKNGADGCVALIDGESLAQQAIPVAVIDPVGAGDAFVAGYLAELLAGADARQRLRTAVAMGAYAVTVPGDCELLPTRAELAAASGLSDVVR